MFKTPLSDDELLAASILARRRVAPHDRLVESAALDALLGRINAAPDNALTALVETVVELCGAGSAGVSLLEGDRFFWPAIAGAWAQYAELGLPRDASPCGVVIDRNAALLFDRPQRLFPDASGDPEITELLLVPLLFGGEPKGTLWALSHNEKQFDIEDARVLERLGLVAAAIEATKRARMRDQRTVASSSDRVRNTLAIMRRLVRVSNESSQSSEAMALVKLSSRLEAYAEGATAHGHSEEVGLWTLLAQLLLQHGEGPDERVRLIGPDLFISVDQGGPVALAVHELLQNTFDHGALSQPEGRVEIIWEVVCESGGDRLIFSWNEHGTTVGGLDARGFGKELLEDGLAALVGGETELSASDDGLRFSMTMPLTQFNV